MIKVIDLNHDIDVYHQKYTIDSDTLIYTFIFFLMAHGVDDAKYKEYAKDLDDNAVEFFE